MSEAAKKAARFIGDHHSFVVAAHLNPEGDALGASLGLAHIVKATGKKAEVFNGDPVPENLKFLPGAGHVIHSAGELEKPDAVIVLDCGDFDRPGPEFAEFSKGLPLLNIDHHPTNTGFGDPSWVDPKSGSTAEMIVILAREMGVKPGPEAALCLYTGILTDTGSFQFSNTTARALEAAAEMVEAGADPELAARQYYHSKPASHVMLWSSVFSTLEFDPKATRGEVVVTTKMYQEAGVGPEAVEGIVNLILDAETAKVAVLYRQTGPDKWKVSLRSKSNVDVARVARSFGGGGHKNAAGCSMDGDIAAVKARINQALDAEPAGSN